VGEDFSATGNGPDMFAYAGAEKSPPFRTENMQLWQGMHRETHPENDEQEKPYTDKKISSRGPTIQEALRSEWPYAKASWRDYAEKGTDSKEAVELIYFLIQKIHAECVQVIHFLELAPCNR